MWIECSYLFKSFAETPSQVKWIPFYFSNPFSSIERFRCDEPISVAWFSWLQMIIINSRAHSNHSHRRTNQRKRNKRKQKQDTEMMKRESKIIISLCSFFSFRVFFFFFNFGWGRDEIVSTPARCASNWCRWLTGAGTFEIVVRLPQPAVFYFEHSQLTYTQ